MNIMTQSFLPHFYSLLHDCIKKFYINETHLSTIHSFHRTEHDMKITTKLKSQTYLVEFGGIHLIFYGNIDNTSIQALQLPLSVRRSRS